MGKIDKASKKPAASSSAPKTSPTRAPPSPAATPQAKLIARSVADKQARLASEGRADIKLVKRRRARIAEDFYDIGEALARLKRPGVAEALEFASFADLCERELDMSVGKATYLIAVVTHVPRAEATRLGQDRTVALLELADATPELDTVTQLAKGTLKLPGGGELHVPKASAAEIRNAAKLVRAGSAKASDTPAKRARGRTTTPNERAIAAKLQARLRELGLDQASVTAVATKPGQPAHVRIQSLPIDRLSVLKKAL